MWRRYRFQTHAIDDPRPLIFDPRYPWWVSGYDGFMQDYATIIAWLPAGEPLTTYWDDAYEVEYTEHQAIEFASRFPKPDYFVESEG